MKQMGRDVATERLRSFSGPLAERCRSGSVSWRAFTARPHPPGSLTCPAGGLLLQHHHPLYLLDDVEREDLRDPGGWARLSFCFLSFAHRFQTQMKREAMKR